MHLLSYRSGFALLIALSSIAPSGTASANSQLAVAWQDTTTGAGMIQALEVQAPWGYASNSLEVGSNPILRFAEQQLFVVSPTDDTLQIVDPQSWTLQSTFALPAGTAPTDVAVIDRQTAIVTANNSSQMLQLDLNSGVVTSYVDLSPLFDEEVMIDLGTMTVHEDQLFVQIQFAHSIAQPPTFFPGSLAVVDLTTGTLVDVDPVLSGTQSIALDGTGPKFKMQVVPFTNELFVSATGSFFDNGGIEVIDLATLTSKGLVIAESDGNTAADLSAFVMVTPEDGFLTFSTDFATSSHLHQFSRTTGVDPLELHVSVPYLAPGLIYEEQFGQIFLPQGGFIPSGIRVFDAFDGSELTGDVIPFGDDPTDLVLFEVIPEPASAALLIGVGLVASCVRPWRNNRN